ncbi:unnamed protein product [Linum trigynum]|uniref:HSF-type DNA-binding domain-containing protein n=1 Tax=Linum trigynum TaxID=586398 RepID=A0AAV2FFR0_9ROSI
MNPRGGRGGGCSAGSSSASIAAAGGGGGGLPRPMEGLHDAGPPPFLTKTYEIVEDSSTNHIVSWSRGNNSFVVWDPQAFSLTLLPKFFKHNNFSSFVRQLNTYGFRKVDPDRWEFANEGFLRGQKHLLKHIRRRKGPPPPQHPQLMTTVAADPSCVEVGRFGLDGELDRLRRDKQVLMAELVKLRQQQTTTRACLQLMEQRLGRTESKQQQMMAFLAKAMQNPDFVQQLVRQKDVMRELEEVISKKRPRRRRRVIEQAGLGDVEDVGGGFVKVEAREFGGLGEISELDSLALDIQGLSGGGGRGRERVEGDGNEGINVDGDEEEEGFWEDLLNGEIGEEMGLMLGDGNEDDDDEENVDVLVEQLGFLVSN